MSNTNNLYTYILKNGLQQYKFKNSNDRPTHYQEQPGKKGVSFVFRSKAQMTSARGFIVTSEEAIQENKDHLSHWTPNVYSWGGYVDLERKHVMGFFEENLMQINTYVIDIDCSKEVVSSDDILLAGMDLGVAPTLIVESPNGYQAYFVLNQPSFISKANDFKSLRTNKAIAYSLKLAFSKEIEGVDFGCNPFGIFRFPNEHNIVFYDPDNRFDFKTLMTWSMKVSDDYHQEQQDQFMKQFKTSDFKQTQTSWFKSLLNQTEIKGGKGVLGRNSALFTASLACYSSNLDQDTCIELMTDFNASLSYPLSEREIRKTVRSAYSGRYKGASAHYIQLLNEQWVGDDIRAESSNKGVWYKFAKPREERQKSHYSEWRRDLIRLIERTATKSQGFVQFTRKELIKALGIPESSLKDLLRQMKNDDYVTIKTKPGRNGYTRLWTVKSIVLSLIRSKRVKQLADKAGLLQTLAPIQTLIEKVSNKPINREKLQEIILKEIVNTS